MTSTFFGLNIALSGLQAQQRALDITSHNVANANTEGYTRQDAQMVAADPYPIPTASIAGQAGQLGTGVDISMIRRLRDSFLDNQVRDQVGSQGYWNTKQDYLEQIETIFNEPSDQGVNNLLTKFWGAWQDLAANPEAYASRVAVVQSAAVLAGVLKRDYQQLDSLRAQADDEIESKVSQINDWLTEIASLNKQISAVEVQQASDFDPNVKVAKDQANDLRDRRDLLLDQLSKSINVNYREESDGTVTIWLGSASNPPDASDLANPIAKQVLVQADTHHYLLRGPDTTVAGVTTWGKVVWSYDEDPSTNDTTNATPSLTDDQVDANLTDGELKALQDMRDSVLDPSTTDSVAYRLDQLAVKIIEVVNGIHDDGYGLTADPTEVPGPADSRPFFAMANPGAPPNYIVSTGAADIEVNPVLLADPNLVRAAAAPSGAGSTIGKPGDGNQAAAIGNALREGTVTIGGRTTKIADWYRAMISQLGIDGQQARDMSKNQGLLVDRLTKNRESFSGVSLDEEAANVVRFQRAFQAAARVMNAMDEMLDKLVNGVGIVGR